MKKLNITYCNGNNKEDAILKIKDDSFSITTNDNSIIKIPYADIKNYDYAENEKLIIKRKHNSDIVIEVSFDTTLINTLKEIVKKENSESQSKKYTNDDTPVDKTIEEKRVENVSKEKQVNSTDEVNVNYNQNDSNESNPLKTISAIISIIVLVIIVINFFGNGGHIEGAYLAEQSALEEIPESVLTLAFEHAVTSNELKCNAKEKTDDEIILVKCTTTNEHIIDYYKSETIWYAYQETADGSYHYRAINPDKNKALESIRKR